jgi:hypothetical protein
MLSPGILEFIWQHREDDPRQMALSGKKYPGLPMAELASQVQALQKIRHKIPSWYRPGMYFPFPLSVEQASSEATAKFKAGLFEVDKMADLTGGMGVDAGFFAQKAQSLTYVEQNAALLEATRHNFQTLGIAGVDWYQGTAESFLATHPGGLDLIYLDPARRHDAKGKVFQLADCTPDVLQLKTLLFQKARRVLLKTAPLLDLKEAARQLGQVAGIRVVAAQGECREVLYLLEPHTPSWENVPIQAVHLQEGGMAIFTFHWQEEQEAMAILSPPLQYLYEPNPAILKAGAFKSFGLRYGLGKLHTHTHLYTSAQLVEHVPARCFVVDQVCRYDRKAVQAAVPDGRANITCRNFPDTPDQVRKKLGLKDGGEVYLFAATVMEQQKVIVVGRKVEVTAGLAANV